MKLRTLSAATAAAVLTTTLGVAALRPAAPQMGMPATEQHELLKRFVGDWKFTLQMPDTGMGAMVLEGTETTTMMGELWVRGEVDCDVMGTPFRGLGVTGYDSEKQKYVSYWFDVFTDRCSVAEGEWHADEEHLVMDSEPKPDMQGRTGVERSIITFPDESSMHVDTTWIYGDGAEQPGMTFRYTRRP